MSNEGKGVSNCYVFKSRLQEYAQKVGFPTPVYETIKEGPSHEPFFRSTVIVNNVRYDSLPGFSNRKAAEQSAAEVALLELEKCGEMKECISQPVHETGLCKNLLQEYAQKMNYAVPTYECRRQDTAGKITNFSCTVEIGGIRYIGAFARTKKEAEIKAARTALLAIQSSSSEMGENPKEETHYTVLPCKRKEPETITSEQEAVKTRKPKKGRFRKKFLKKRHHVGGGNQIHFGRVDATSANLSPNGLLNQSHGESHGDTLGLEGLVMPNVQISDCQTISMNMDQSYGDISALEAGFTPFGNGFSNSQVSECQPVTEGATRTVHNENLNIIYQSHGDRSDLEFLGASLVTNSNSMQKNDAVDLPAVGCIVQPSGLGLSNVSDSKEHDEETGVPVDSSVTKDSPILVPGDGSLETNKNTCVGHVGSVMNASVASVENQLAMGWNEPAAALSSMDHMGDSTVQANSA